MELLISHHTLTLHSRLPPVSNISSIMLGFPGQRLESSLTLLFFSVSTWALSPIPISSRFYFLNISRILPLLSKCMTSTPIWTSLSHGHDCNSLPAALSPHPTLTPVQFHKIARVVFKMYMWSYHTSVHESPYTPAVENKVLWLLCTVSSTWPTALQHCLWPRPLLPAPASSHSAPPPQSPVVCEQAPLLLATRILIFQPLSLECSSSTYFHGSLPHFLLGRKYH